MVCLLQFIIHVPLVFVLLGFRDTLGPSLTFAIGMWLLLGFFLQGRLLEGKSIYSLEWLRIVSGLLLAGLIQQHTSSLIGQKDPSILDAPNLFMLSLTIYLFVSAVINQIGQFVGRRQSPG